MMMLLFGLATRCVSNHCSVCADCVDVYDNALRCQAMCCWLLMLRVVCLQRTALSNDCAAVVGVVLRTHCVANQWLAWC